MSRTIGLIFEKEKKQEPAKEPSKFDGMDVDQLKAYAAEQGIDIGNSTAVSGILKKIKAAENEEDKIGAEDETIDPAE